MAQRIAALQEALEAHAIATSAAAAIENILRRHGAGQATLSTMQDELDEATAAMLAASEQMRSAIHRVHSIEARATGGF